MKRAEVKVVRGDKWQIERELVLKEGKIYVLRDEELRAEIIWLHYNVPVAEHREKWKMTKLVTRNYWWLEVIRDIGKYVEECDMCQRMKNRMEVPEKLWTYLTVDFITKLLVVAGKDAILVVCNRLSKIMHFVATMEGMSAEGLVRLFRDNM